MELNEKFGCSPEHVKLAFRCVIKQGPIDPKAAEELASRVHNCWMSPEGPKKETNAAANSASEVSMRGPSASSPQAAFEMCIWRWNSAIQSDASCRSSA